MSWIKLHDSAREHPKIQKLARRLGVPHVQAIGHVVAMWTWAHRSSAGVGVIGHDADDVAIAAMWDGDSEKLLESMRSVRLVDVDADGAIIVHDWRSHAGSYGAQSRQRQKRERDKADALDRDDEVTEVAMSRDGHVTVTSLKRDGCATVTGKKRREEKRIEETETTPPRTRTRHSTDLDDSTRDGPSPPEPSTQPPEPTPTPHPIAVHPPGLDELQRAVADAGIAIQLSASDRAKWQRLYPVEPFELDHAVGKAMAAGAQRAGYVLGVIASERKRAAEAPEQPRARASPVRDIRVGWDPGSRPEDFADGRDMVL